MNTDLRKNAMPREIAQLDTYVRNLPEIYREELKPILNRVVSGWRRRNAVNKMFQEALEQLRLDIKYLEFDLEATRRERDDLERYFDGF